VGSDIDVVRRLNDEAFIGGNPGVTDELLADDYLTHDPVPGMGGTKDSLRFAAAMVSNAFSDRRFEFNDHAETTDGRVVNSWAMTATHTGDVFGLPASGQQVTIRGVEIWRCAGGKIAEHWGAIDMSDLFAKAAGPR
jgi:steroid delta-isomerase-like uncharacterized protein